ncbi:hypothetical protein FSP39_010155 [Pinctada imbricata]|uniref:F-box/WD repeat-containing protein 4 n=1 Tax=Pinctada imbricata TaxID=66713 RepID=A0AA88XZW7_PINIB|nr:hypothetical protein FSP39_010155 [Pinctada imbricata]
MNRQLPWLVYSKEELWISDLHCIKCYQQQGNGHLQEKPKCLRGLQDDVSKFVVRDSKVVSGCRDGSVFVWDSYTGRVITEFQQLHQYDAQAVDIHDNVLVSGSRDHTVQVLKQKISPKSACIGHFSCSRTSDIAFRRDFVTNAKYKFSFNELTVLCVNNLFVFICINIYIESYTAIGYLGEDLKYGSGMLDMKYESPHTLLTCGYDTCLRLWDTRTNECVKKWEEPFDTAIDCVQSDDDFTMFAGTSRHGMVRVWDKRQTQPIQMYYTGRKRNSPVYSIAFNHEKLFCALDIGVQVLDFNTQQKDYTIAEHDTCSLYNENFIYFDIEVSNSRLDPGSFTCVHVYLVL